MSSSLSATRTTHRPSYWRTAEETPQTTTTTRASSSTTTATALTPWGTGGPTEEARRQARRPRMRVTCRPGSRRTGGCPARPARSRFPPFPRPGRRRSVVRCVRCVFVFFGLCVHYLFWGGGGIEYRTGDRPKMWSLDYQLPVHVAKRNKAAALMYSAFRPNLGINLPRVASP